MQGRDFEGGFSDAANRNIRKNRGGSLSLEPVENNNKTPPNAFSIVERIMAFREQAISRQHSLLGRLQKLGVCHDQYMEALSRSRETGASLVQELIASQTIHADDYFRALAEELNFEFVETINPAHILSDMNSDLMEKGLVCQLFTRGANGLTILHVAPDRTGEVAILELLIKDPLQRERIRVCTPRTILSALEAKKACAALARATSNLHDKRPELSAKQVFAPWQAFWLGTICVALPIGLYFVFFVTSFIIHLFASLMFSCVIFIRLKALMALKKRKAKPPAPALHSYPKYSVLVALYKEAAIASQLIRAMSKLDWPSSRLEVFYVCEADDSATIEALTVHGLPHNHRIIKVPYGLPRTKPKALNYALSSATGDFIVIYDAEDRPHPRQLKEAWQRFSNSDDRLACLQAPLTVTNSSVSWFARLFAFEYASHFKGLLPYLAFNKLPLPLGGTSNHFKKSALESVGGWDPYNVTEDADLGIRFARFGYTCDVLELATLEDAPEIICEWYPQRTRWKKGWMQTFLVQNRNVSELFKALGGKSAMHFEVILLGFILSPLLFIPSLLMIAYSFYTLTPNHLSFAFLDIILLAMGYFCSLAIGLECSKSETKKAKAIIIVTLPFYWILQSAASWRAAYQLIVKPHHWEKTPHRPKEPNAPVEERA
jgi:cellulose synthase/poly-beta-1,6-N-acetylglucosamine synthase-like glycosyltransferase